MQVWYDEECEEPTIFGTDDYEFLIYPRKAERVGAKRASKFLKEEFNKMEDKNGNQN